MNEQVRVAIFISGRGSNLEALIAASHACGDACGHHHGRYTRLHTAAIALVIADRPASGLEIARYNDIPHHLLAVAQSPSRQAYAARLLGVLAEHEIDLICLAGFMTILGVDLVAAYWQRILNIHPSLLPAYPGLDTHARALAGGEEYAGCTVHLVDGGIDTGAILAQSRLKIGNAETPEHLGRRVLALEHRLYPQVVESFARDLQATGYRAEGSLPYLPGLQTAS